MTSKYTLNDALAFLAITGGKRGLTVNTRIAMYDYTDFNIEECRDELNIDGIFRRGKSRIWKAHCYLRALGFKPTTSRTMTKSFMPYHHPEEAERSAFMSKGRVYVSPKGTWRSEMVAEFQNG